MVGNKLVGAVDMRSLNLAAGDEGLAAEGFQEIIYVVALGEAMVVYEAFVGAHAGAFSASDHQSEQRIHERGRLSREEQVIEFCI